MIEFKRKTYSTKDEIHDIIETGSGAGVVAGAGYGTKHLLKLKNKMKEIQALEKAGNEARDQYNKLSKQSIRNRVKKGLKNTPEFKRHIPKAKIGAGIALGSGLVFGANELIKRNSHE